MTAVYVDSVIAVLGRLTDKDVGELALACLQQLPNDDAIAAVVKWSRDHIDDGYADELVASIEADQE